MADDKDQTEEVLPACWSDLIRYRSGFRPSLFTYLGFSDRAPPDRLLRLLDTEHAQRVLSLLGSLPAAELNRVKAAAEINADQAESAFRRTLVFNITGPIAFLATAAQVAPQLSAAVLESLDRENARSLLTLLVITLIVATVFYTFVRSRDARELADIVALVHSKRSA